MVRKMNNRFMSVQCLTQTIKPVEPLPKVVFQKINQRTTFLQDILD